MDDVKGGNHQATADTEVLNWSVFGMLKGSQETKVTVVELLRGKMGKNTFREVPGVRAYTYHAL